MTHVDPTYLEYDIDILDLIWLLGNYNVPGRTNQPTNYELSKVTKSVDLKMTSYTINKVHLNYSIVPNKKTICITIGEVLLLKGRCEPPTHVHTWLHRFVQQRNKTCLLVGLPILHDIMHL